MKPVDPRLLRYATASRGFFAVSAAIVLAQTGAIVGFAWALTSALVGAIQGQPVGELWGSIGAAAFFALLRGLLIAASERTSLAGRRRPRRSCARPWSPRWAVSVRAGSASATPPPSR